MDGVLISCHNISHIGSFCGIVGYEYDFLEFVPATSDGHGVLSLLPKANNGTIVFYQNNLAAATFTSDINALWNVTTQQWMIQEGDFLNTDYYIFEDGTAKALGTLSVNDPAMGTCIVDEIAHAVSPFILCNYIIWPNCGQSDGNGGNFLYLTGFATVPDCVAFMTGLNLMTNLGPYPQAENTVACEVPLHGLIAGVSPSSAFTHCPHVSSSSVPCSDAAWQAACPSTDPNASCVDNRPNSPLVPAFYQFNYEDKCKNGYVGDGSVCTELLCNKHGKCPAIKGTYVCSINNTCECIEGFLNNPNGDLTTESYCNCPNPTDVIRDDGVELLCVVAGRCLVGHDHNCHLYQDAGESTCVAAANPCAQTGLCTCNPGFQGGGIASQCVCSVEKSVVTSSYYRRKDLHLAARENVRKKTSLLRTYSGHGKRRYELQFSVKRDVRVMRNGSLRTFFFSKSPSREHRVKK